VAELSAAEQHLVGALMRPPERLPILNFCAVKRRFFLLCGRVNTSAASPAATNRWHAYLNWHLPDPQVSSSFVLCGFVGFHCKARFDEMVSLHSKSEQHAPAYASDAAALEAAGKKEVLKVWHLQRNSGADGS